MSVNYLETPVASRYFTFGNLNEKTKFVWLACHGYGQLAEYFIKKFEILDPELHYVIAPEGMNRFYLEGFSGRVGASWMTKEDREKDIEAYCKQLNKIRELIPLRADLKWIHFGFSQGTSTITRWMSVQNKKCHHLVLWGGRVAKEIDAKQLNKLNESLTFLFGEQDEFYEPKLLNEYTKTLKEEGLEFNFQSYNGGHGLNERVIFDLAETMQ